MILAVALLDGAGIACFSVGLKTCAITAAMKTYKSIINIKERSMLNSVVLETNLNTLEVFNSIALMSPYTNYWEFFSVNNVLREYNEMKEEIKNSENALE